MGDWNERVERMTSIDSEVQAFLARCKPRTLLTPEELAEREALEARERELADRRARLKASGIVRWLPGREADAARIVAGSLAVKPALQTVAAWWSGGAYAKPWLFVSGTTGIGKTWAAAWLLAERRGLYVLSAKLTRIHRAERSALGPQQVEHAETAWLALCDAPVLVLDELGREPLETVKDALHDLVDQRGTRPTLVLSNVASPDLKAAFIAGTLDRRTASRLEPLVLKDPSGKGCWDITGPDMRLAT